MSNLKKTAKLQSYAIVAILGVITGVVGFWLINLAIGQPNKNSGLYPTNGSYKIISKDILCELSYPPRCSGDVVLSDKEPTRIQAKVDSSTKVRYQSKEIQIYPDALKEGMVGQITFKPNSSIIDSFVIPD